LTCIRGDSTGPTYGTCADWRAFQSYCPAPDPCLTNLSCGDCVLAGNCGWCQSTVQCLSGTTDGPAVGTCADWRSYYSECE
jgi:hypothetical protein